MIEETTIRSLHVEALRHEDLHAGHDDHALFQASTVSALLDGAYDGDLTFAELAREGDTGLGTLNGLDGEMIAFDGRFFRADVNGDLNEIGPEERTPFALVTRFESETSFEVEEPLGLEELQSLLDRDRSVAPVAAFRIEGRFSAVKARSVPKQRAPYRSLPEVVADQNVFELGPADGTLIGFRFPAWAEGVEIGGYHFHFADHALRRGGHVLDLTIDSGTVRVQHADDLHVELPPGLELGSPDLATNTHEAIARVEHGS
ncbi:MAG: acetolactate decarboxylase [Actinomycetota bacterium]|nr:acetolactate decarboxylase [Actinomycetota bacterium]